MQRHQARPIGEPVEDMAVIDDTVAHLVNHRVIVDDRVVPVEQAGIVVGQVMRREGAVGDVPLVMVHVDRIGRFQRVD